MTAAEIVAELKPLGYASYKNTLLNHGVQEPVFGIKIEELKKVHKRIKTNYQLALDLYDTGIYDIMYLAGLIAPASGDTPAMTKKDLKKWLANATCDALAQYTVAWVAADSPHGHDLALEWIDSKKERVALAGWSTLSSIVAITDDADLDISELKKLLQRAQKTIHDQPNAVRYAMNGFVIAVGSYVKSLTPLALDAAKKIGEVNVDLPGDCKLPPATTYIQKVQKRGTIGKKRKSPKC